MTEKNLDVECVFVDRESADEAAVAQLVEHHVANVNVTSSSLVSRSNLSLIKASLDIDITENIVTKWRVGRVVMQRIANPCTPVRFWYPPPLLM